MSLQNVCGLEVFNEDTDILVQESISRRIRFESITAREIVRYTVTSVPVQLPIAQHGLEFFLGAFDQHLNDLAKSVGGEVVKHSWGLIERTSTIGKYYTDELSIFGLPNHLLAARVEIINGTPLSKFRTEDVEPIRKKLEEKKQMQLKEQGWTSDAARYVQFTATNLSGTPGLVLHDIEPRIYMLEHFWNP